MLHLRNSNISSNNLSIIIKSKRLNVKEILGKNNDNASYEKFK